MSGIALYPQPVSSLGHGSERPRVSCAQSGIARDGGRDNSGAPVRSLPGLLDAATRGMPVAPDIASAPRDNGSDRERKAGADPGLFGSFMWLQPPPSCPRLQEHHRKNDRPAYSGDAYSPGQITAAPARSAREAGGVPVWL